MPRLQLKVTKSCTEDETSMYERMNGILTQKGTYEGIGTYFDVMCGINRVTIHLRWPALVHSSIRS
eukprot:scaffold564317_cov18-Prasinocladus_malaysianus.AAC.1